jgi:hypothetical protein
MIIVGGRTRSGARSHRSTPGPDGFREPCLAGLAGQGVTIFGPTAGNDAAASGHSSIAGSARRLDMRS